MFKCAIVLKRWNMFGVGWREGVLENREFEREGDMRVEEGECETG